MNTKLILLAISGSLLLGTAGLRAEDVTSTTAPTAARPHGGPMMGEHLLGPKIVEKLNLSADQKTKYDAIDASYAKTHEQYVAAHKADIDAAHAALKQARESKDKTEIKAAQDQMQKAMAGLEPQRKAAMEQVKSLLTDDQKKTLAEGAQWHHGAKSGGHAPAN